MGNRAPHEVFADCDFMLHGSGPGLIGVKEMQLWAKTSKPYGFGGITLNDEELRDHADLMRGAKFLFCRDTLSLQAAREAGIGAQFFPDATFFLDLKNEDAAEKFLAEKRLEPKNFACFIPRLRWTPYWIQNPQFYLPEAIAQKEAENARNVELDHAKMREAIVAWVRQTGQKALLCPEMTYEIELLRPYLFDPLPDDVKPLVELRESYWLTDEAASVYEKASTILSFECHSPIMAIESGTPAIYLRQPTDTRKGQMYRDIGLGEWILEIEETSGAQISRRLLSLLEPGAAHSIAAAHEFNAARRAEFINALSAL